MKHYNESLDFIALAMSQMAQGHVKTAAKFFRDAVMAADAPKAVAIIEASNAQAYKSHVQAQAKARAEASVSPEMKALAALGADREEIGMEPEGEPEKVEDKAVEEEDEDDGEEFRAALAALAQPRSK